MVMTSVLSTQVKEMASEQEIFIGNVTEYLIQSHSSSLLPVEFSVATPHNHGNQLISILKTRRLIFFRSQINRSLKSKENL